MSILANQSHSQAIGLNVGPRCFNSPLLQRSITPVPHCLINRSRQGSTRPEIGGYPSLTNIDEWIFGWKAIQERRQLLQRLPPRSQPKAPP